MVGKKLATVVALATAISCIAILYRWAPSDLQSGSDVEIEACCEVLEETYEITKPELKPVSPVVVKRVSQEKNAENSDNSVQIQESDHETRKHLKIIADAQKEALGILESKIGWTHAKGNSLKEGMVYSKSVKPWGTVYKLEATMDGITSKVLFNDMIVNSEVVPTWNPTMKEVKVIKSLNNNTEISYSVSAPAAGGFVSSRDFVYIRHWELLNGWLTTSSVSIKYAKIPPVNGKVRGEQGPSVIRMKDTGPNSLTIQWLLNTDIKGTVPSWALKSAFSGTLVTYLQHLNKHSVTLVK